MFSTLEKGGHLRAEKFTSFLNRRGIKLEPDNATTVYFKSGFTAVDTYQGKWRSTPEYEYGVILELKRTSEKLFASETWPVSNLFMKIGH